MKLAIIGYGRMGHEIEEAATARGHIIKLVVDIDNTVDLNREKMKDVDVAIEFSSPHSAFPKATWTGRCGVTGLAESRRFSSVRRGLAKGGSSPRKCCLKRSGCSTGAWPSRRLPRNSACHSTRCAGRCGTVV